VAENAPLTKKNVTIRNATPVPRFLDRQAAPKTRLDANTLG
jgi:hypothetical protein